MGACGPPRTRPPSGIARVSAASRAVRPAQHRSVVGPGHPPTMGTVDRDGVARRWPRSSVRADAATSVSPRRARQRGSRRDSPAPHMSCPPARASTEAIRSTTVSRGCSTTTAAPTSSTCVTSPTSAWSPKWLIWPPPARPAARLGHQSTCCPPGPRRIPRLAPIPSRSHRREGPYARSTRRQCQSTLDQRTWRPAGRPDRRELWIWRAGQVAAYRERWHVADDLDVMLCEAGLDPRATSDPLSARLA